jgi:hypothetical protein
MTRQLTACRSTSGGATFAFLVDFPQEFAPTLIHSHCCHRAHIDYTFTPKKKYMKHRPLYANIEAFVVCNKLCNVAIRLGTLDSQLDKQHR